MKTKEEFLSVQEIQQMLTETFADDTMSDEDLTIARLVQNRVLVKVAQQLEGMDDGVWANTCGDRIRKLKA